MKPKICATLDAGFAPMALVCKKMREETALCGQDIVIGAERNKGYIKHMFLRF